MRGQSCEFLHVCMCHKLRVVECMQGDVAQLKEYRKIHETSINRALKDVDGASGDEELTVVTTTEGLQKALDLGKRHIEIREHLDFTKIRPDGDVLESTSLDEPTWSIRVRFCFPC
jgi:hypothetical protein